MAATVTVSRIILASASPRRAALLAQIGIPFEQLAVDVEEAVRPGETAEEAAVRLALEKADRAASQVKGAAIVLAADTQVEVEGRNLGKPADADDAARMLRLLAGRTHRVVTGVAALRLPDQAVRTAAECTLVSFAPLTEEEIRAYVATGEPMDKAGGYGIQGWAGVFVTRIEGCYFNVVGLPLYRTVVLLRELGWRPPTSTW
jgi:septum formation protein